jgi:hypothetical protein
MYDDLRKAVGGIYPKVNWYAFGEAVVLATAIREACERYDKNPEEKKMLKAVAERTLEFLRRNNHRSQEFQNLEEAFNPLFYEE